MEILVSISSLIIALCALVFTIWQTNIQRIHNRLSVKPHLFIFTTKDKHNDLARLQVLLKNNGLGPAFIKRFQIYYQGQECDPDVAIRTVLGEWAKNSSRTILGDEYAMPEKGEEVLLSVTFPAESDEVVENIEKKINQLDLVIEYSSAYEKMKTYDSRKNG